MGSDPQSYLQYQYDRDKAEHQAPLMVEICKLNIELMEARHDCDRAKKEYQNAMLDKMHRVKRYLMALRDGVDEPEIHCLKLPTGSSWRYMVDKALEALEG